jgi:hypothetical protein
VGILISKFTSNNDKWGIRNHVTKTEYSILK